ncbi:MAG: hypothetical protein HYT08_00855 [Candidatus Levybacteria bacterium]|nr:hypothetical protein [Candidatus Levybacteria bacterium]
MKIQSKIIFIIIFLSLLIRLAIIGFHIKDPNYSIQQDNYINYTQYLKDKIVNNSDFPKDTLDTRLFPGYPVVILLLESIYKSFITSGLVISLISSLLSIYFFWLLTKNNWAAFFFSLFPPVWVIQSTKIATEPITVFLLLLAIILYRRNLFLITGLTIGFATDIRLISICLFLAMVIHLYLNNKRKHLLSLTAGFLMIFSFLFLFNYLIFGISGIFQQFIVYPVHGRATFGVIQIFKDIPRAIDWGQYRILASGIFYLILNFFGFILLYKHRSLSWFHQISFFWMGLSLLFIFFIGPTPFLEEFSRFSVPFAPALIIGISTLFTARNKNLKLKA